ncbi:NAD-dependent epimerase/dehydratase family protein [Pararoseomonas indoligenes]|uniref:NAD(P)-dependent oxidoreductase n=1 Tax=Roseomonas indoligenes TaxID=2820811 RepID=A0A940S3X9_9PROT|nr:NAD(P)-dependent oxidoreductase [Pararoseomonas indoligenes]MBP0491425.1 NAD(P)-dependent oxidoreductase [Pararoseomonas indoligenes]
MALLVTGASGFVALNVVEALLTRGEEVVALDARPLPPMAATLFAALPGRLHAVVGDATRAEDLDAAFARAPVRAVLHAAAVTAGTARERADPGTVAAVNLGGSIACFAAALRAGAERLVAPSSGAVYGVPDTVPDLFREDDPARPTALYGITKLAAEQALLRLASLEGLSVAAPRLGGIYGRWEHPTGLRDTLSPPFEITAQALSGTPVRLAGARRGDQVHAADIAAGLIALLDTPVARGVFNIGSGEATGPEEYCAALARALPGLDWRVAEPGEAATVTGRFPADRPALSLDRMAQATGWRPRIGLEEGAALTLAWMRDARL